MSDFRAVTPFAIDFDLKTGLSQTRPTLRRTLSNMKGMYADKQAFEEALKEGDPLVYEFYELELPENPGHIAFGASIVYPGEIGGEYSMTKGHFHTILDIAEVYYCLAGKGLMLMENPEGDVYVEEFSPGRAVYVPGRYAHRSINTGTETLVTFYAFRADAGHDYGTIETKGFRKIVVEQEGTPVMVDNPNWKV
jgi:glucose-6-phosphate isomerase